jgi:hypothetical protein
MFGKSEVSAASSFWRRAETVKARVEGATLREARRRERVADCRRAMIVCLRACYRQHGGQLGRNDMMVIIGPAAVGQSEGGGVRAGHSLLLLRGLSSSRCELLFPAAAAVTHHHSTVPSPSNSLRKLPVLVLRFVKAPAFHPLRLRVLSLYAFFSFHQYFGIHTQPTPCRGPSKISSSTTMRKRHVPSVSRSLISQIEAFGPASVVIRCVLAVCPRNTSTS